MNHKGWNSDGNRLGVVLCCAVPTGDWSEPGSIKSFGGGNKSQTPSHGSAGDNAALPGNPTAWEYPFFVLLCY